MLKNTIIVIGMLFLTLNASAAISLIEPLQTTVENNSTVTLGQMMAGETVKLMVSRRAMDGKWDTVKVQVPREWTAITETQDQTFIVRVTAPENVRKETYNLKMEVEKNEVKENITAIVIVQEDLLTVSMEDLIQEVNVGDRVKFKLHLFNNSLAEHSVKIESGLPAYWMPAQEITVLPNENKEITLEMDARVHGQRAFEFNITSLRSNQTLKVFPAQLTIRSTLKSKYNAVLNGFPFFNISMIPYYLMNGFASYFIPN